MKTDLQVQRDVEEELRCDPRVEAGQITVTAQRGAVELKGTVATYAARWAAEDAAKRVEGVRTVKHDLIVDLPVRHQRSDATLAAAVEAALAWDVCVPETVTSSVAAGAVTLKGFVTWNFQREAATAAVRRLAGVVAVHEEIVLAPRNTLVEVREHVMAALRRQARRDGRSIQVASSAGKVTLSGHATSRQAIEEAVTTAWAAPGVTEVIDRVELRPEPSPEDGARTTVGARWDRRVNAR